MNQPSKGSAGPYTYGQRTNVAGGILRHEIMDGSGSAIAFATPQHAPVLANALNAFEGKRLAALPQAEKLREIREQARLAEESPNVTDKEVRDLISAALSDAIGVINELLDGLEPRATAEEVFDRMRPEILDDIATLERRGGARVDLSSFSDLHQFWDANSYGHVAGEVTPLDSWNAASDMVNEWLLIRSLAANWAERKRNAGQFTTTDSALLWAYDNQDAWPTGAHITLAALNAVVENIAYYSQP